MNVFSSVVPATQTPTKTSSTPKKTASTSITPLSTRPSLPTTQFSNITNSLSKTLPKTPAPITRPINTNTTTIQTTASTGLPIISCDKVLTNDEISRIVGSLFTFDPNSQNVNLARINNLFLPFENLFSSIQKELTELQITRDRVISEINSLETSSKDCSAQAEQLKDKLRQLNSEYSDLITVRTNGNELRTHLRALANSILDINDDSQNFTKSKQDIVVYFNAVYTKLCSLIRGVQDYLRRLNAKLTELQTLQSCTDDAQLLTEIADLEKRIAETKQRLRDAIVASNDLTDCGRLSPHLRNTDTQPSEVSQNTDTQPSEVSQEVSVTQDEAEVRAQFSGGEEQTPPMQTSTATPTTESKPFPWLWVALGVAAVGGGYAYYRYSKSKT